MDPKPILNESFDDTIVIDGLPIVDPAKGTKLIAFVNKKFEAYKPVNTELPTGPDDNSLGFIFMRLETPELARQALQMTGKPMDKTHTFAVTLFSDVDKYQSVPDDYTPLPATAVTKKPLPYLQDYLLDPAGREQILLRFQDADVHHTHINYVDPHTDEGLIQHYTAEEHTSVGKSLTQSVAGFSSKGSFMYTFHQQGIALWGGENYQRCTSIAHPNVCEVSFSPCERWVVTMSEQDAPSIFCDVAVWDIATGQPIVRYNTILRDQKWPFFKWSYDGKFFGRLANKREEIKDKLTDKVLEVKFTPIGIAIYDVEKKETVGGKPLPVQDILDFQFSPSGPELAYCTIGKEMIPSSLVIYDCYRRSELRHNRIFGVTNWQLEWQKSGQHLLVYVERKVDKKSTAHSINVYNIKSKGCPLVEHQLPKQAARVQISPTQHKVLVTSYQINAKSQSKAEFAIFSFDDRHINQLWTETIPVPSHAASLTGPGLNSTFQTQWSPQGEIFYIATFGLQGNVTLYDASKPLHIDILASDLQLAHANKIEWDYTGRFFALASLHQYTTQVRTKYNEEWKNNILSRLQIYNFQGALINDSKFTHLFTFEWRPQPIIALTTEQSKQVIEDLRTKYWNKFENQDDKFEKSKHNEVSKIRQALKSAWKELRAKHIAAYVATHEIRASFYDGYASEDDPEDAYETFEIVKRKIIHKDGSKTDIVEEKE